MSRIFFLIRIVLINSILNCHYQVHQRNGTFCQYVKQPVHELQLVNRNFETFSNSSGIVAMLMEILLSSFNRK
jgi:hypothetical protein